MRNEYRCDCLVETRLVGKIGIREELAISTINILDSVQAVFQLLFVSLIQNRFPSDF